MEYQNWPQWWKINREISQEVWDNLSNDIREIISNDTLHLSETFKWFFAHCEAETNRLLKDQYYKLNNINSFY